MKTGIGHATGHHGELLQGAFTHKQRVQPALITLPTRSLAATAVFTPHEQPAVTLTDPRLKKAHRAATLTIDYLRGCGLSHPPGGHLQLNNPMGVGLGLGSSTADVVATIRAVADCAGVTISAPCIAKLAIEAEGASDPIMWSHHSSVTLFAYRQGAALRTWNQPLPPFQVVGCCCGAPVDTNALHRRDAPFSDCEVEEYDQLIHYFHIALRNKDAAGIGDIATRSAVLNQSRLPNHHLPLLQDICADCRGVGVQIAHSGAVAGILFSPDTHPKRIRRCIHACREAGFNMTLENLENTDDYVQHPRLTCPR